MGNSWIASETLFNRLGLEVIVPPKTTKYTMELGVKYAPEFACFPLKLTLGNFIEAAEKGADTFLMPGGIGPCRFGFYGPINKEILEELGYRVNLVIAEPPAVGLPTMLKGISPLLSNISYSRVKSAANIAWEKLKVIDHMDYHISRRYPHEITPHSLDKLHNHCLEKLRQSEDQENINKIRSEFDRELSSLIYSCNNEKPLSILIVGEIFLVLDYFSNLNIEAKIGRLGAQVQRSIYMSEWILQNIVPGNHAQKKHKSKVEYTAQPYINDFIGGHGRESVGETILAKQEGYDGVIHVSPFTCMPEITAMEVLPKVSEDINIPVLSLIFDEQTGEAGIQTRLEAFMDLLKKKQERVRISN